MDCQSTNIIEIWKELATLSVNSNNEINNGLQEQTFRLDVIYQNLLQAAQKDSSAYLPDKKISKKISRTKNGYVDLFSAEPGFQQPAVPPIRRTKRQASIAAMNKTKNVRESATISSSATRASRARALSTFDMDIAPSFPKANSTFVVDNKFLENVEECLSPQMFSPETKTNKKRGISDETYTMPVKSSAIKANEENSNSSFKIGSKKNGLESQTKNKQREKLEDIDINNIDIINEQPSQHMTRTMKRKLQEESQTIAKKPNVIHVPLENLKTPLKPSEDVIQTPHQIRENEAEKRKELYLKNKTDQRKNDDQQLKAAKQREEQLKRHKDLLKKSAEEKRKKEEKIKEKELMQKEELLKKQKQAEIRLAEVNAKRKQNEEAKFLKLKKAETERLMKENEMKKKNEIKPEKSHLKVGTSNIPATSLKKTSAKKVPSLPKSKNEDTEGTVNDYGLNDISAHDSSDDEAGPKKAVPNWAKRESRVPVLELQYHVDAKERELFFNCPKSMSLKEMFKGWKIHDRQRTSSAVWNTPPRYSEYIRRN